MGYITIDKKAFFNNADFYTKLIGSKDKLCMALKDNAYGHGIIPMAKLCQEYGIKHTIVRTIAEADIASSFGFDSIIVLYETPTTNHPTNYIFALNSLDDMALCPPKTKIELKIDTGMSRNGICIKDIDKVVQLIQSSKLILNGVFTHFCCADECIDVTKEQEKKFLEVVKHIKQEISTPFRIHCANSEGVAIVDNSLYDMARIGIGLYGYSTRSQDSLKPVMSLWANKISTRVLDDSNAVGYGATHKIKNKNTTVSNYNIGYGDGFFRVNERMSVKIANNKNILGRVSMDSFSLEGNDDAVCVFNDARHLAKVHNTIEYEILTHLMPHIKRTIIQDV